MENIYIIPILFFLGTFVYITFDTFKHFKNKNISSSN